jgi:hypothetical protein
LRGGPRGFRPGFTCPVVLRWSDGEGKRFRLQGCYLLWPVFPDCSANVCLCNSPIALRNDRADSYNPECAWPAGSSTHSVWADPFSLATTQGVEVSFSSSGYLDVSVRRLTLSRPMCSDGDTRALPRVGFPIRKSAGQRSFSTSPRLIAAAHVLHRLLVPRHPPHALNILT